MGTTRIVRNRLSCFLWLSCMVIVSPIFQSRMAAESEISQELVEPLRKANEFWLKGNANNGIPEYLALLPKMEKAFGKDSAVEGIVLFRIGFLYGTQGEFEKALPYFERCE